MKPPDVLVLGGGGLLGEVWMNAVLTGLQQAAGLDARESRSFIGTSAGSIAAAALAAGVEPHARLGRLARTPSPSQAEPAAAATEGGQALNAQALNAQALKALAGLGAAAAAPLSSLALGSPARLAAGALLRRTLLARAPIGRRSLADLGSAVDRLELDWDGRLQISAVELESGRRVMFGARDARRVTVSQAVRASCAIPGVFKPVRAGRRTYVDGGVWSPTNMDAAEVTRGTRVLCLNPTGAIRPSPRSPAGALGTVSRSIAMAEALALRHRGARVRLVSPDEPSRRAMGTNLLDPRPRAEVIAAGLEQGRLLAATIEP